MQKVRILPILFLVTFLMSCQGETVKSEMAAPVVESEPSRFMYGDEAFLEKVDSLSGLTVGVVAHHASYINDVHLVDTLMQLGVKVQAIFAPEHGFRGNADAGADINNEVDERTGLPVYSLHGKSKKPSVDQLQGIDVLLFDLQDVGVRFYTYISTLHYVMEACAEQGVKVIVLDRPNPNDHYVDGPILKEKFKSFVGMHPVPVVYGMTIGEYAQMINGEFWLKDSIQCDLEVIEMPNYHHGMPVQLPIKPSPNLPNMRSIDLYPSLCFFEGTVVSVGRGTSFPFQVYGHPSFEGQKAFQFTPQPTVGASSPKLNGEVCFGEDLRKDTLRSMDGLNLDWLVEAYGMSDRPSEFFLKNHFIDLLAGTDELRKWIVAGQSADEIQKKWSVELGEFRQTRSKYLIYP